MVDGKQGYILVSQERDDKVSEQKRLSVPQPSSGNWVTYPITLRGPVSDCRNSCLYFFFCRASLHGRWQSKAGIAHLHRDGSCGALTFAYFSAEQIQGTGKKNYLKSAKTCLYECIPSLISGNILDLSPPPPCQGQTPTSFRNTTTLLPTYSADTEVHHF